MRRHEREFWKDGYLYVAGVDEAGRGPLAGPVVAACVILPQRTPRALKGLTDSKQLSAAKREQYALALRECAVAIGVGRAEPEEIDEINILQATFLAMRRAIAQVPDAQSLLVDGNLAIPGLPLPQRALVGGDGASLAIAAASVVAKVTRDAWMVELDARHPEYGFARHKGYGTKAHYEALASVGPCPHHRRSFLR